MDVILEIFAVIYNNLSNMAIVKGEFSLPGPVNTSVEGIFTAVY